MPKVRVFEVVQYEKNPKTGEDLKFDESNIKKAVSHKTIKEWAYIRHDKDNNTIEDEANGVGDADTPRPAHWHCVCRCSCPLDLPTIAKWFGVPQNCIDIPRGRGAFTDKLEYLTHEDEKQQAKGKHRYENSEVKSNFDWRKLVDEKQARLLKYGRDLGDKEALRYEVLYNGMTIREVIDRDPLAYQEDYRKLDELRKKYLSDRAPMPITRINYYVCGDGGLGKGMICRALARSLYPDIKDDEDIFFEVGAKNAAFEGYDGQPVIIWHDRRAFDLLNELGGRGNLFNVFDSHPTRSKQNIKYSSVVLVNEVNIVNSVQPYEEFLDGLAGQYETKSGEIMKAEDKSQSYRRFPFIIPLHEKDFDLLMNKGFFEGTRDYNEYIKYKNIRGSMAMIAEKCGTNQELARRIEAKTVKPVIQKHDELLEKIAKRDKRSTEDIEKEFEGYGVFEGEPEEQKTGVSSAPSESGQMALEGFEDVEIDELPFDKK